MQQAAEKKPVPAFYTVDDMRRILGIGRNSAYGLVNKKGFPCVRVGSRIVIPADLFHEWVARQAQGGKGGGAYGRRPQG